MRRIEDRVREFVCSHSHTILLTAGAALALLLRYALLDFESGDYRTLLRWCNFIERHGRFRAFQFEFSNYAPLYPHMLSVATLGPWPKLYAIKLVSILFDFVTAGAVYKLAERRHRDSLIPLSAGLSVLFAPTVFLNSAFWGQSDAIFGSMVLFSLLFSMRRRQDIALVCYGVAVSLKPQALLILPVFLFMWLAGGLRLGKLVYVPLVYLVTILPSLLAGRPFQELLTIYSRQLNDQRLSMHAPNWYSWVPDADRYYAFLNPLGLVLAAMLVVFLLLALTRGLQGREMDDETCVRVSFLLALVVPFVLPQMHERYFYVADLLAIVYALYVPRRFWVPVVMISVSLFSYFPFLFRQAFIGLEYLALVLLALIVAVGHDTFANLSATSREAGATNDGLHAVE
jgi:Gpi18-like mannosyltransferase